MAGKPTQLREKQHLATTEAMLDGAQRAMILHGFEKVTMQQIAEATGCAPGTLYLYFKNKQELFEAITARHLKSVYESWLAQTAAIENPLEKVRMLLVGMFRESSENPDLFRMFLTAMPTRHRDVRQQLDRMAGGLHSRLEEMLTSYLRQAQEQGLVRRDVPAETLHEFMDAVAFNTMERALFCEPRQDPQEQLPMVWSLVRGGMVHQE